MHIRITKEEDRKIREAIERCGGREGFGLRYPENTMKYCFGDCVELGE